MIFEIDAFGEPVGDGATGARYCFIGGVVKVDVPGSELAVVNECVETFTNEWDRRGKSLARI